MVEQIERTDPSSNEGTIYVRDFSSISVVTIRRPTAHNAMTSRMWRELRNIGRKLGSNPRTRVVLVRGAFDYFTAGSDLKEFSHMSEDEVDEAFSLMEEAISTFERLPIPTVASIKGSAMGAGLELALACDLRVMAENARLGMPIARLGITIGTPFAKRLVDLVGPSKAKDILFTGRTLTSREATEMGLTNYAAPARKVDYVALRLAKTISNNSPASVRTAKEAIAQCIPYREVPWRPRNNPFWVDTADFREGVSAFVEKRLPNFKRYKKSRLVTKM